MVLSTLLNFPAPGRRDHLGPDVSSQKAVAEMLVGFRGGDAKSIIVITHDIRSVPDRRQHPVMYAGQLVEKASTKTIINSPRHIYQLLISSLPKVGVKYAEQRLAGIPGNPPLLLNRPRAAGSGTAAP